MRAYVLINTGVGQEHGVATQLASVADPRLTVVHADPVLGPYELILECESPNLDQLVDALEQVVQQVPGVVRTTTCLSVRFA